MARRQKRSAKTSTWLWYGLYAVAGYYGYGWFKQYQMQQALKAQTLTTVPAGTVNGEEDYPVGRGYSRG